MIDESEAGSWAAALLPDNRSLRTLSDETLQSPFIVESICRWWGCTPDVALEAKGAELLRRTQTTELPA